MVAYYVATIKRYSKTTPSYKEFSDYTHRISFYGNSVL